MKFFGSLVEGNGWVGKYYKLGKQIFDLLSLQSIDLKKYPYLLDSSSRGNKKNRFSILFQNLSDFSHLSFFYFHPFFLNL